MLRKSFILLTVTAAALGLTSGCKDKTTTPPPTADTTTVDVPSFNADSAYAHIVTQCDFGPRVPDSEAHSHCGDYIVAAFERLGLTVTEQRTQVQRWDGQTVGCRNLIAAFAPEALDRIMVCAHWDSRPWADHDPDSTKWHTPVPAANDGASGVAVMIEVARQLVARQPAIGVDFVCFDCEDAGTPEWANAEDSEDSWCLGSQYWAKNPHYRDVLPRYAILLDMVGGPDARFCYEGYSLHYAQTVVDKVWSAAERAGYGEFFPRQDGGYITDDHVPLNEAGIPAIDIIPYYANTATGFCPTWHTVSDTPEHIDKNALQAAGQTLLQVIYEEK